MQHIVVDAYGCNSSRLDNLMDVYTVMNDILNKMSVEAVMPIQLVPYYYCENVDDVGISAFVLTKGGQLTMHTFPRLGCYFLDLMYDGFANATILRDLLKDEFQCDKLDIHKIDRAECDKEDGGVPYGVVDFGPHYMIKATLKKAPTIDEWFHTLDRIPYQVGMHPITRPCVVTDRVEDPNYLSAIVVIAESHIAMHYNYRTGEILMDIFSCKSIEEKDYQDMMQDLFKGEAYEDLLIPRGSKHDSRQQKQIDKHYSFNRWQEYIQKND